MNNTREFLNKNNILKIVSIVIMVMLLLSCITIQEKSEKVKTVGAFTLITEAIQDIDYSYSNNVLTINTDKPITITNTNTTTDSIFVDGNYDTNITLDGVTIDVSSKSKGALVIEDNNTKNVTITLADGSENTLKSDWKYAGIQKNGDVSSGNLLIRCESDGDKGHICTNVCGEVNALAEDWAAGIGGAGDSSSNCQDGSNITINGGKITASGVYGSGIGGGPYADGNNITINGGTVTVTSVSGGSGIGGGKYGGDGNDITINGGTVTATGASGGSGIGGGADGAGRSIIINGGTVNATGGGSASGIGGGINGEGSNIKIKDGYVEATAGNKSVAGGAGIGGGLNSGVNNQYGMGIDIEISGGTVIATGAYQAAGIGAGDNSSAKNIRITGGDVTAIGGGGGASIGGSYYGYAEGIVISGGTVIAGSDSIENSIGIGAGIADYYYSALLNTTVIITGGTVIAKGTNQAINASADNITLTNVDIIKACTDVAGVNDVLLLDKENIDDYLYVEIGIYTGDFEVTGTCYSFDRTNRILNIQDGAEVIIKNKNIDTATTDRIVVASGASAIITLAGVNINVNVDSSIDYNRAAFEIAENSTGNVKIILANKTQNTLTSGNNGAAIQKNGGTTTGNLLVTCDFDEGSGHICNSDCGQITLNPGNYGAGIGGGRSGAGSNITIGGGNINITAGRYGAGIGGGNYGSGNHLTVNGGKIIIIGGGEGAGIGGGCNGNGDNIIVSKGIVTVKEPASYDSGAGIGGGKHGAGSNITISGGEVNVCGRKYAAGIGGGQSGIGTVINITGGNVTAIGGEQGAGIGGGQYGEGSAIKITGGIVTAKGGDKGAGIGGGSSASGNNISIEGGKIDAIGGEQAAGIGGGINVAGSNITIIGEEVRARGGKCAVEGATISLDILEASTEYEPEEYTQGQLEPRPLIENITSYKYVKLRELPFVIVGGKLGDDYEYDEAYTVLTIKTATQLKVSNKKSEATTARIVVASGVDADITLAGVNIDVSEIADAAAFKIEDNSKGNVTIILANDKTNILKSGNNRAGLQKNGMFISEEEGKLVINCEGAGADHTCNNTCGKIEVYGKSRGAGIGGSESKVGSNIIIGGGHITSQGGSGGGAGIGGGYNKEGNYIDITGGIVHATALGSGAGIGGGIFKEGSFITINKGTIIATSKGTAGAGIGGGQSGAGNYINIGGGHITSQGGSDGGAGIGGGYYGEGSNITITNGTVIAQGGRGAGIGGGREKAGSVIKITGGEVIATSQAFGAGIGGGQDGVASNITITGGEVTATSQGYGAGIGGGYNGSGSDIQITGGDIKATASTYGAGIGGGQNGSGSGITIKGGTVIATGGTLGTGIGAGKGSTDGSIEIHNPTSVIAKGRYRAINGNLDLSNGNLSITEASSKDINGTYTSADCVDFPSNDATSLSTYLYVKIGTKTINVTITWGNLDYEYKAGPWQTDSLEYAQGEFVPTVTNGGDKITVQNDSNVNIVATITCTIDSPYEYIHTSILETKPSGTDIKGQPKTVYKSNFVDMYLVLTGKLPVGVTKQKVGHVTVALDN